MKIFNLDGLAIFGPGSEWLWAMVQCAALVLTGLAIYRQLRAQSSANELHALESLIGQWDSERMMRMRLAALMRIAGAKPGWNPQYGALGVVGNFLEGIATLQANGHLQMTDTWHNWSDYVQFWWAVAAPFIDKLRETTPGGWDEWEKLAVRMADLDRKAGRVVEYNAALVARELPDLIASIIGELELEQAAKTGIIPTWPIPGATPEA